MRKLIVNIYLTIESNKIKVECKGIVHNPYFTEIDLFDYKYDFLFTAEKVDKFLNKDNIYFFRIYKLGINNHFKLYDYKETYIKRFLGYYDSDNYYIIIFYQITTNIKYFYLKYMNNIFNIENYNETVELKTDEYKEYDVNELIPGLSNIGQLYVENIIKTIDGSVSSEYFGIDYNNTFMNDNKINLEKSFHAWYEYNLSFIDHVENDYTRIYYIYNIFIFVQTCFSSTFVTCYDNYNQCDEYGNGIYALLIDNDKIAYPTTKNVKGYIFNNNTKIFQKCYSSCDFCYESSNNIEEHKCESCADGYLLSYAHFGNCYKINYLSLTDDKEANGNVNFVYNPCGDKSKINNNGECIQQCPTSTPFYIYNYNESTKQYNKIEKVLPPKYLYNKKCYESCPSDSNTIMDETNNICKCKKFLFIP